MKMLASTALLALALAAAPAIAASVKVGDLTIKDAWARATPKGAPVGAGYLTIENGGATADRLTGIAVDFANVQVHEMSMNNGVMKMREVAGGVEIPAHKTVTLAPSGYHLMFMQLKHPMVKGQPFKATLTFQHAGQATVEFPVMPVGSPGPDMKGMKM
ncbi:MAG TPA: copper chaperone PCu(A)C [Roseiarcus sp.]|nr:copper chaperone PCu(A)C [Roseiarcus sp.]